MRVALFVSCLVDLFRPSAGFAAVKLLERLGAEVVVPPAQTCCGQPAYNSGDFNTARELARPLIDALGFYEHVVVPSGSCTGMLVTHYPELFKAEPLWQAKAETLAARTRELSAFLAEHGGDDFIDASFAGKVAMHDSCSARRELGVFDQPRALLAKVSGLEQVELQDAETCCGFGGTFLRERIRTVSGRIGGRQGRGGRGERRRPAGLRRHRLPDEHRRASQAHGQPGAGVSPRRSAGRHD